MNNTSELSNPQLIIEIKKCLQEIHEGKFIGRKEWTDAFKVGLKKIGIDNKFKVYPNPDNKDGEWLVDLCWSIEGDDWKEEFKGLKLACEIEWNRSVDDILFDFQKLTVIDSEIRLMIFQFNSEKEFEDIMAAIIKASKHSQQKGNRYIIVGTGNNESNIRIFEW
ncbi:MAG: hypothetical protein IPO21_17360 [Bacteroidales bacterium]|nr:hypothetical protein [Bacteroidales bacterium]